MSEQLKGALKIRYFVIFGTLVVVGFIWIFLAIADVHSELRILRIQINATDESCYDHFETVYKRIEKLEATP
jgi:hypothetical protein